MNAINTDIDFSQPLKTDVVIAGAGLAGLVTGAILAKQGKRVVIIDLPPQIGGRCGSTPYKKYWIDGGHRDGSDIGDLQVGWSYGQLAAKAADVTVPLRIVPPVVRVHHLPGTGTDGATMTPGKWGPEGFLQMSTAIFGCPEDEVNTLMTIVMKLAMADTAEREAMLPVSMIEWLKGETDSRAVQTAVLTMLKVVYCEFPERASTGRVMAFFFQDPSVPEPQPAFANHPTVGGIQGLIQPFADAIVERGGQILLGMKPACVVYEGKRATGLVAVNDANLALEIEAHATVIAYPLWQATSLIGSAHLCSEWKTMATALEDEQADAICWQAGLTRAPKLRSTGEPDSHLGWNRVLTGPGKGYNGGWHLPSLASQAMAPPGHHMLHAFVGRWLEKSETVSWQESKKQIGRVRDYLYEFYSDLDECVEWSAYQLVERPACLAWIWAGVKRHGVRVPGVDGLYIASTTMESDGGPVDIGAHAGLEASKAISEDFAAS